MLKAVCGELSWNVRLLLPYPMKSFKTLDLSIEFYDEVLAVQAKGNLKDQLLRAASSI